LFAGRHAFFAEHGTRAVGEKLPSARNRELKIIVAAKILNTTEPKLREKE